jgi:hypothetical protein
MPEHSACILALTGKQICQLQNEKAGDGFGEDHLALSTDVRIASRRDAL